MLSAREFAQAVAIPTAGSPTTLLFTALGTPVFVALSTAVATTATQATVGAQTIVVAIGTSIAIGQLVVAAGVPSGAFVTSVNGTTIGISQGTTAALSATAVNFVAQVTLSTGVAVTANWPVPLAINSNTFISYISSNGGSPAIGNYPGFGIPTQVNVVACT